MTRSSLALVLACTACGDDAAPRPPPDLDAVVAEFRGTTTPMAELMGIAAGQLTSVHAGEAFESFAEQQLQQIGLRTVRGDLRWHDAEPTRGAFDASGYLQRVDALTAAGVTALPILCYGAPWANTAGEIFAPPDDPADYAAFAGASATVLGGTVPALEIWNEPNLGFQFWKPRESPARYGELLSTAASAIRAASPTTTIVFGGLLYHGLFNTSAEQFVQGLFEEHPRIGSAFDVFAFHPYPLYPPVVAPEIDDPGRGEIALARMVARIRALLVHHMGEPGPPIWITEVGWPVYQTTDEERQARWLVRSALLLAGAGVDRVFWYTMFDGPDPGAFPPEDAFGLFHWDDDPSDGFSPSPKPAWTALATLLARTGSLAVTSDVTAELSGAPADARAYRLTDPTGASARRVTAVWRADDGAAAVPVTV